MENESVGITNPEISMTENYNFQHCVRMTSCRNFITKCNQTGFKQRLQLLYLVVDCFDNILKFTKFTINAIRCNDTI